MNFRTTLILLVLLVGALVFMLIVKFGDNTPVVTDDTSPTAVEDKQKGRALLDIKADDVQKLVITPDSGGPMELVRESATKWKLVKPVEWPAARSQVDSLLSALVGLRSRGQIDLTGANKATLGLEKPRFVVELFGPGGKTQKLAVGKRRPLGSETAVIANNEAAGSLTLGGVALERLEGGFQKLVDSLREPALVQGVLAPNVTRMEIERPGGEKFVLSRGTGSQWELVSPEPLRADSEDVNTLIASITNLSASEFASDVPASVAAAMESPVATVRLWTGLPNASTNATTQPSLPPAVVAVIVQPVDVNRREAWVRVGTPGVVAKAPYTSQEFDRLLKLSPLTLRNRKVFAADSSSSITSLKLTVETPGQPVQNTVLTRRPQVPAATQPAATQSASPATQPTTSPTTKQAAGNAWLRGLARIAPVFSTVSLLQAEPTSAAVLPAATQPATQASTQPTTKPAAPKMPQTEWLLGSNLDAEANDLAVDSLVESLATLKALRYVEPAKASTQPATKPAGAAIAVAVTFKSANGAETTQIVKITDPGEGKPLIGELNGLTIELDRSLLAKLTRSYEAGSPPPEGSRPPTGGMPPMDGLPPGLDPRMFAPPPRR